MKKRVLAFLLAIALVFSLFTLSGCQKDGGSSTEDGKIKLSFYGYGLQAFTNIPGYEDQTQDLGDIYQVMVDGFKKDHPNVDIEVTVINPAGGNTEQLDTDIASGSIPDLYFDNQMRIAKYEGQGLLADLTPYLDDEIINDYASGTFSGDTIWRLPIDMTVHFMAINKTLVEEIGAEDLLPDESREWTFDQFMELMDAVKAANLTDKYPTILWAANPSGDVCNFGYLWGFGARLFDNGDYSKTVINSPEAVKAFQFMSDLVQNGYAVPGAASLTDDDMLAMFPAGQLAVTGGYAYLESAAKDAETPFEPYLVNFPHDEGQENPPFAVHSHAIAVFKSDDQAKTEMAIEFAKYIAGEDWAPLLCQAESAPTARNSFADKVTLSEQINIIQQKVSENGLVDFGATCPQFQEIRNDYVNELQSLFNGTKTAEQAIADLETNINKTLNS